MNKPVAVFAALTVLWSLNGAPAFRSALQDGDVKAQGAAERSTDCTAKSTPQGFSRIFISADGAANRRGSQKGLGSTASDPYDGSTAEKFDTILRSRSEANQQNLIVCIGPGTFQTG